jgi:hypothetical protein
MGYTVHNSEVIDARIERDLQLMKNELVQRFGDRIASLILIGGFPRGEGSVLIENGSVRPLIDYDIVIATKGSLDENILTKCSEELVDKIGLAGKNFHVDLIPISTRSFRKLPFTQFNYDLRYASKVFYGDKHILSLIPEFDPRKMPLETARFLLFNRMINFIYTFSYDFIDKRSPTNEESLLLKYQCLKNVLDAGTALLILQGEYDPSYRERNRRFKGLYSEKEKWTDLHQKATDFKLDSINNPIGISPVSLWFQTKEVYEEMFRLFVSRMYGRVFNDWIEFVEFYQRANKWHLLKSRLFQKVRRICGKSISAVNRPMIELAEILVVFALSRDDINEDYLKEAISILGYYPKNDVWENLRRELDIRWHNS